MIISATRYIMALQSSYRRNNLHLCGLYRKRIEDDGGLMYMYNYDPAVVKIFNFFALSRGCGCGNTYPLFV